MADRRLALAEPGAEVGHVEFAVLGQIEQDPQASLVAEELEHLGKLADGLLGDGRHDRQGLRLLDSSLAFFEVGVSSGHGMPDCLSR